MNRRAAIKRHAITANSRVNGVEPLRMLLSITDGRVRSAPAASRRFELRVSVIFTLGLYLAIGVESGFAQTVSANGGTANSIPKFSNSTTLVNSIMTESDGKIGIGTSNLTAPLDIAGYLHVSGETNPITNSQGGYFGWNALTGGEGETDFINNQGGGSGGFAFFNTSSTGSPRTTLVRIEGSGKLNVGGSVATGGPGNGVYLRDATNDPNKNTFVTPLLLHEGLISGNGSTLGWGLHLSSIPWTWGQDPMYYHAGIHVFNTIQGNGPESEAMRIIANGNVGIGTGAPGAKLEVNGNIKLSGAGASINFADGSTQSTAWSGTLCGGDYAESVSSSGDSRSYEPGDVLVVSESDSADIAKSSQPYSTLVAGIYSTKPGVLGRRQTGEKSDREIPMAMVGIVPTKVSTENGPIRKGDLLVTSSIAGHAMKGTDPTRMLGAIVGKALGQLESGEGVIEVLVSLQ